MKKILNKISAISKGIGQDKYLHFIVSLVLAFIVATIFPFNAVANIVVALIAVFDIGLAKEVYDERTGGTFDFYDIVADMLGAVVGLGLYLISAL